MLMVQDTLVHKFSKCQLWVDMDNLQWVEHMDNQWLNLDMVNQWLNLDMVNQWLNLDMVNQCNLNMDNQV
jgi:hypothetical protein